jgi:hypothetical protein
LSDEVEYPYRRCTGVTGREGECKARATFVVTMREDYVVEKIAKEFQKKWTVRPGGTMETTDGRLVELPAIKLQKFACALHRNEPDVVHCQKIEEFFDDVTVQATENSFEKAEK